MGKIDCGLHWSSVKERCSFAPSISFSIQILSPTTSPITVSSHARRAASGLTVNTSS